MTQAALSLAVRHDNLLPQPPGGNGPGAVLALLVHGVLLLALTTAVNWRTQAPEVVSAELWASVPQIAAPAPPPPLPAPTPAPSPVAPPQAAPQPQRVEPAVPQADIAVERARQKKAEADRKRAEEAAEAENKRAAAAADKKRAEDDKRKLEADRKKREQEAREAKAEEEKLAQQREANLRRMMGQAGNATSNPGGTGTAAQNAAPSAAYAGRLIARIRPNIVYTGDAPASATAEVEVTAAPAGTIISRRLTKSSGHPEWDEAVLRAIDRTPALPRDTDGRVPDRLTISFRRD